MTHKGKNGFVDDIVKGLAELDKEEEKEAAQDKKTKVEKVEDKVEEKVEVKEEKKEKKETKTERPNTKGADDKKTIAKPVAKADEVKADDTIPMDNEAIKAYSGVIADAAEDSEPEHPVMYTQQSGDLNQAPRADHAPSNRI